MITTRLHEGISTLVLDMPGRSMNVLTPDLARILGVTLDGLLADNRVTGIVITSGKAVFAAGADLAQIADFAREGVSPAQALAMIAVYGDLFRRIERSGKPVVAAANGTALGGGFELMLACHYRVAADVAGAQFGLPEVKLGLLPGAGGTQRVPRLVGIAASLPLLLQGTALSPAQAKDMGLVDAVVPPEDLLRTAEDLLRQGRIKPMAPWDGKGYTLPGGDAYAPANATALRLAIASARTSTHDRQPAPTAILRCVYEGSKLPVDKALRLEQKHFVTLVQGTAAQNMVRTFLARQRADKLRRRPDGVASGKITRLGIVGAGLMGSGIAQVSAAAGIDVTLLDRDLSTATSGMQSAVRGLQEDARKGRLPQADAAAAVRRLQAAETYAALEGCELVIEAVAENPAVKAGVTRRVEEHLRDGAMYASNTSALPIGELAQASLRPQSFIGLHFFSPVPRMSLVEIVVGRQTSPETLARAMDYVRQLRKTPVVVNDGYGFFTTRCVEAYVREGLRLLAEGVQPALIENLAVRTGMPVGPLALCDEVGIDVFEHIAGLFRSKETGVRAEDRHAYSNAILQEMLQAGRKGRKAGRGFYVYSDTAPKRLDAGCLGCWPLRSAALAEAAIQERLLYAQIVEAAHCWHEGVIVDVDDADLAAVLGWSFPAELGGPMAVIASQGEAAFAARSAELAQRYGERFRAPAPLRLAR